jgi:hypothetical protein
VRTRASTAGEIQQKLGLLIRVFRGLYFCYGGAALWCRGGCPQPQNPDPAREDTRPYNEICDEDEDEHDDEDEGRGD